MQLWVSIRDRDANRVFAGDPWDGRSLEWSTSSPPPEYNFAIVPTVVERDAFYEAKRRGAPYRRITPGAYADIEVPRNSGTGVVIGVSGAVAAFGLVWHIWWLVIAATTVVMAAVIARSFVRDTHRIVPAAEVERADVRWLAAVARSTPVERALEMTSANHGLAKAA